MIELNLHELEITMYAIIKTGGKQLRVTKDDVIDVELLKAEIGSTVEFQEVLFVNDGTAPQVGQPIVSGFIVKGEILGNTVGPKEKSIKYTPREHSKTQWGHRQHYTRVKITECGAGTASEKPKKTAAKRKVKKEEGAE
jgi:large subunit ribosomal protein L21